MWRFNAQERRRELKEKHPAKYKAYLKKQREIMRKKYKKRRRLELGPNIKIKRKPKDRKES
jgi:hypothetical protein